MEEKLQSDFRPSDSCVNQLLAIKHEMFEAFDCHPPLQVRSVFLDISKTFDKAWHEGLLYKLKSLVISAELYNLLENCLSGILVIKKNFKQNLTRQSLVTIYKAFLRPLIDYGDIIYDQPQNESFREKKKSVQYKATLVITGAIQGISHDKIYQELRLK